MVAKYHQKSIDLFATVKPIVPTLQKYFTSLRKGPTSSFAPCQHLHYVPHTRNSMRLYFVLRIPKMARVTILVLKVAALNERIREQSSFGP